MSKIIYTKEKLEEAVKSSNCYSQAFKKLGLVTGGNSYQRLKILVSKYEIDTSHFLSKTQAGFVNSGIGNNKKSWQEWLIFYPEEYRRLDSKVIRRSLIESGREYKCVGCGLESIWNGKKITLQVDHIDGNYINCLPHNLRFLCPNCHTQATEESSKGNRCENCKKKVTSKSSWCKNCYPIFVKKTRKVENRPSIEQLIQEIEMFGYVGTGKIYGVSDNAIRKWVKRPV